jgi:integrase
MALSDLKVKKISPQNKRFEVSDGKGLSIRVMPSGTKSWVFRYLFDGIPRRMTLGNYPTMGMAEAREKHAKALQDVERGIDPGKIQQEEKAYRKSAPTFKQMVVEFSECVLHYKKAGDATLKLIEKDAIPAWKNRKLASIKRRDIVLLYDEVKARAPVTANRLIGALSRLFRFAVGRGVIDSSPCTVIEKIPEKSRSRTLSDEEIRLLWDALDIDNKQIDLFRQTKLALKMILLSGARGGEVAGMQWDEIKDDVWTIPGSRSKNGDDLEIPLMPLMLDILGRARTLSGDKDYVFGSSHHDAPLTVRALSKAVNRHWSEMKIKTQFTPHDVRRTVRTKLAEIGVDDVVAERLMGHRLQGMMRVYNRHSYLDEKRSALLKWENRLHEIIGLNAPESGKIIQLRK